MDEIQNPHDKFVKEFFSNTNNAVSFFKAYLPENVLYQVELGSLEPKKDSFIDQELAEYFADFLYKVGFKDQSSGYVYILLEHKSYSDSYTDFQLLRYMVRIWEGLLKEKRNANLPVIIPFVLYHGKTEWRYGLDFKRHFQCPEDLKIYIPDFQYALLDASKLPDDKILGGVLHVFLHTLKYSQREELVERLPTLFKSLAEMSEKKTAIEYLEILLRYLMNIISDEIVPFDRFKEMITNSFEHKGGDVMGTIADMLRNEGHEKGIQKGIQQGILKTERENIVDILETRFGALPDKVKDKIQGMSDPVALKKILKMAVVIRSIDEFQKEVESSVVH